MWEPGVSSSGFCSNCVQVRYAELVGDKGTCVLGEEVLVPNRPGPFREFAGEGGRVEVQIRDLTGQQVPDDHQQLAAAATKATLLPRRLVMF